MSAQDERWIEVQRWQEFQHYKDRGPVWIKDYVRQVRDDDYLALTLDARGLLHDLRLLYAEQGGPFRESFALARLATSERHDDVTLRTQQRRKRVAHVSFARHLEALNHAGFIDLSASKPLAERYPVETEKEKRPPQTPPNPTRLDHRRPDPSTACPDCGEKLGHGHLETCRRMPRTAEAIA